MYEGDRTTIQLGKLRRTIEVTSGIRQGCSISTLLFKLVTFTMIEKLREKADPFKIGKCEDNSLWLADDATIIATDKVSLLKALEVLEEAGKVNDLIISEEKTKIIKIRGPDKDEKIGKFKVEKETKYLGIQVGGRSRDIFAAENKIWIQKAEKKANELICQIKSSCDMVTVGKKQFGK